MTKTNTGPLRSLLAVGVVTALATVAIALVRNNSSDDGRDRNIAGGADVAITGAPYQVGLLSYSLKSDGTRDGNGLTCGGALIAAKWVLTADHCIWRDAADRIYPNQVFIGAGGSQFWDPLQSRQAMRIVPARGVAGAWPNADLALVELDSELKLSATVRAATLPVGLDSATWPANGATGLITGWGVTLDDAVRTSLRGVTMKVNAAIDSPYCIDDAVPPYAYYAADFVAARHLCLLRPATNMDASACSGDSGGPFAVTVGDRTVLAGVASKAARDPRKSPPPPGTPVCTGFTPNLYERVAASLDWIVPGPVVGLSAETIRGVVTLRWEAPAKAPAVAISDYAIEIRPAGAGEWSLLNDGKSTTPSASIADLVDGESLEVRVAAVNAVNEFDATARQFASTTFVVGAPSTTTTSTTTTVVTTTTLAPYTTTTLAPSTTARQLQVGPRPTTTTMRVLPVSTPPLSPTTSRSTSMPAPAATAAIVKVDAEDPTFSQPAVTVPAESAKVLSAPDASSVTTVATRLVPAVGVSLTALQIAEMTKTPVPIGSSVSFVIAKSSAKVCRATGASVTFLAKGTCRATLRVGKKVASAKKKNVKLTVS